jgi:transcriptional regulator with XRE-family HTH domain
MITFVIRIFFIMNERIREFLLAENKSSAQLAEEIGVQPSGISHILSGRNNPSLDFVLKMLEKYQFLSTDWLLFGKGTMYKESKVQSLFEDQGIESEILRDNLKEKIPESNDTGLDFTGKSEQKSFSSSPKISENVVVKKIVWFYNDNSFEEYYPGS